MTNLTLRKKTDTEVKLKKKKKINIHSWGYFPFSYYFLFFNKWIKLILTPFDSSESSQCRAQLQRQPHIWKTCLWWDVERWNSKDPVSQRFPWEIPDPGRLTPCSIPDVRCMIEALAADKDIRLIANAPTTKLLRLLPQPPLAPLDRLNVCLLAAALSEVTSSVLSPLCKPHAPVLRSVSAEVFTYRARFRLFNLCTRGLRLSRRPPTPR